MWRRLANCATPIARSVSLQGQALYPLFWPAQAVSVEHGRIVLPMGRGRQSLGRAGCARAPRGAAHSSGRTAMSCASVQRPPTSSFWSGEGRSTWERSTRPPSPPTRVRRGRLWAGDPLPQTAAPDGPGSARQETETLPARVTTLAQAAACPSAGERPQTAADACAAAPGHPQGDHLLPTAARGPPHQSAAQTACASGTADAITTRGWPCGSTGRTSRISPPKQH